MVAVLAGSTVLSSTVPFLLLWAAYALLCAIRSNLTTLQLFAALRRGMDAGLIAVAIAWVVALLAGGLGTIAAGTVLVRRRATEEL